MELYVKVSFICMMIGLVIRLSILSSVKYPRNETIEIGRDLTGIIANILYGAWAGYLVFFK